MISLLHCHCNVVALTQVARRRLAAWPACDVGRRLTAFIITIVADTPDAQPYGANVRRSSALRLSTLTTIRKVTAMSVETS